MFRGSLTRWLAASAVALFVSATPLFAADKPSDKSSGPQEVTDPKGTKLLKLTGEHPNGKDTITCLVDVNDAPDMKDWGVDAAKYAIKEYPLIEKTLTSDGYTPPREFRLLIKHDKGVAYTSGTVITINFDYVSKHKDDLGMVAHELTHVIQRYRRGEGWITEGIADYVRYYVVEPGSKRANFNAERQSYKGGYQPAAGMLAWIEKEKPGTISKLNAALRGGKYNSDLFKELTGGTPDEMWEKFKETKKK